MNSIDPQPSDEDRRDDGTQNGPARPALPSTTSEAFAHDAISGSSMQEKDAGQKDRDARRVPPFRELMLWTVVVGLIGGLVAVAYYELLEGSMWLVWTGLPKIVQPHLPAAVRTYHWLWIVAGIGGALVGASLKWLGKPGEISAVVNNIHLEGGRIDVRQTPSMIVASLISITFGGSAGPEAPLVQINGSLGSYLGDKLRLAPEIVRTLTFCGMGAALGAFFGAPLGGALFALEIPHRRGLE
ncbi:MAG TPA: chloride channel protein, partial [Minicystis sp.]|nr:chloride channel protein [Minicystis sp.]